MVRSKMAAYLLRQYCGESHSDKTEFVHVLQPSGIIRATMSTPWKTESTLVSQ
jgi:hypothetical protein